MAEKYDAVVIGAGIAGLGVAGLLQRAGMKTAFVASPKQLGKAAVATARKRG